MRFKFKGHTETDATLPGEAMQVIRVVPGEVVELEHKLEDLAEHLWEKTTDPVGRPEQPDTPSDPPAGTTPEDSNPPEEKTQPEASATEAIAPETAPSTTETGTSPPSPEG